MRYAKKKIAKLIKRQEKRLKVLQNQSISKKVKVIKYKKWRASC